MVVSSWPRIEAALIKHGKGFGWWALGGASLALSALSAFKDFSILI